MSRPAEQPLRRLILLGSSGSIGTNTLEVVEHLRASGGPYFEVVGLAARSSAAVLLDQARRFGVRHVAIADAGQAGTLKAIPNVYAGREGACELIEQVARPGDLVMGAMVGSAGVPATIAAIERGCHIALANKETLVAAGQLVMPRVRTKGVNLIPVDSEHSAIFQCIEGSNDRTVAASVGPDRDQPAPSIPRSIEHLVSRIVITASGGPFRTWSRERTERATVEEALNHPTWNMGPKVTIDSASLMNKALEVIEAHWLFDLPAAKIETIIHPQSIVHGLVEFIDGSVVAQLGPPDMKTPIQYALTWPGRAAGCAPRIDWRCLRSLDFEPVDHDRFGAIRLAYRVIETGGTAGAIFNAANEAAVEAFLAERITFGRITHLVSEALENIEAVPVRSMDDVVAADTEARRFVNERCQSPSVRC